MVFCWNTNLIKLTIYQLLIDWLNCKIYCYCVSWLMLLAANSPCSSLSTQIISAKALEWGGLKKGRRLNGWIRTHMNGWIRAHIKGGKCWCRTRTVGRKICLFWVIYGLGYCLHQLNLCITKIVMNCIFLNNFYLLECRQLVHSCQIT